MNYFGFETIYAIDWTELFVLLQHLLHNRGVAV
jgi:hypothetical protein